MKQLLSAILLVTIPYFLQAQAKSFFSSSGEVNFSSAKIISENGNEGGAIVRFAPWFNLQMYRNTDYKSHGYFYGLSIRNIGFIYEKDNEKWKARTYNIGVPLGLKWGDVENGNFVYLGYEIEFPINYKEKYFKDEVKERKFNVWFSDRVSTFTHSAFIGYNFKNGPNLKFKYYFTEFFNKNFNNEGITDSRDLRFPGRGTEGDADYIAPRDYLTVNIFYLALTWDMFSKPEYYKQTVKKESLQSMY